MPIAEQQFKLNNGPSRDVPRIALASAELTKLSKYRGEAVSMTGGVVKTEQRTFHCFPPNLLAFAKILPGNDTCPDCSLRKELVINNVLTWAK